jgi:D-alanyl-D-alanine carboxypeptidase (penicillin-binding protein 5/6)
MADGLIRARRAPHGRHARTRGNQNLMLTGYPGDIGGKLGWTSQAGATYVGMAKRHGVTLIVTLLHCPPLTEFTYAARLLNWGFATDGKVRPVGTLVAPLRPATAGKAKKPRPTRPAGAATAYARPAAARGSAAASGGPPTAPIAGGIGAVLAAALAGGTLLIRRRRAVKATAERSQPGQPLD